ncbi:hypothetical protein BO99DRAFT_2278 [Aspergillus violaceofuscus CBS 115571]|uniref:Uncharacterized protein n=1 Tax=Aspergillus violaceofuscus (strain CBS 115571) TaxID=1450538 RepID=A0A2V5HJQ8_ASPV1|nr:hypothetical protein BO99DRAFT_2278 [Aspergillus violaceofuscus CBS 115571]
MMRWIHFNLLASCMQEGIFLICCLNFYFWLEHTESWISQIVVNARGLDPPRRIIRYMDSYMVPSSIYDYFGMETWFLLGDLRCSI